MLDLCRKHESCFVIFPPQRGVCPICELIDGWRVRLDIQSDEADALWCELVTLRKQIKALEGR